MEQQARNILWSLLGQVLPLIVAIVAIPILVRGLGTDRFGVLTLIWMIIGYFSLFDLGLGRALTKLVAERLQLQDFHGVSEVTWTALLFMLSLGFGAGIFWFAVAPWFVDRVLSMPGDLQIEAGRAFSFVAFAIPAVTLSAGLKGFLEAAGRFRLLAVLNVVAGSLSFAVPALLVSSSDQLVDIALALIAVRLALAGCYLIAVFRESVNIKRSFLFSLSAARKLLGFGLWIAVTNIVGPIMTYLDRFVVGGILSVAAVAHYATPYDLVTKALIIPLAICGVLFPAFVARFASDRSSAAELHLQGIRITWLLLFPVSLVVVTFSYELLSLWIGEQFAANSEGALRWLALGIFINGIASVPYTLVQASGRPDLTAKIHVTELLPYLISVWLLTTNFGIEGTAIAWVGRAVVDALVLFTISGRLIECNAAVTWRVAGFPVLAAIVIFALIFVEDFLVRTLCFITAITTFAFVSWRYALTGSERLLLRNPKRILELTAGRESVSGETN